MQSDLWIRIGESYLRKGDIPQSINSLEKARQGQPNNTALLTNLAMLYETRARTDMARKYYEVVAEGRPEQRAGAEQPGISDQRSRTAI